jgi:cytidine deaminase
VTRSRNASQLLRAAARARANAWAPYSNFAVGAAVLGAGRIFAACNVENVSFPLSVCAERNAVAMAVAAGVTRIDAVAVVGGGGRPTPPCGGCRQVLAEFCSPDAPVVYANPDGETVETTLGALLPRAFGLGDLTAVAASTRTRRGPPDNARSAARRRKSRTSGR